MHIRKGHPFDPGYAVPEYVKREDLARGARTTAYTPRGTFDDPDMSGFNTGYAYPPGVQEDPLDRSQTHVTPYLRRKTIGGRIPDAFGNVELMGLKVPLWAIVAGAAGAWWWMNKKKGR